MSDQSIESRTSAAPLRADQPGLGRAANATKDSRLGPTPKRPVSRVKNSTTRRLQRAGLLDD